MVVSVLSFLGRELAKQALRRVSVESVNITIYALRCNDWNLKDDEYIAVRFSNDWHVDAGVMISKG